MEDLSEMRFVFEPIIVVLIMSFLVVRKLRSDTEKLGDVKIGAID